MHVTVFIRECKLSGNFREHRIAAILRGLYIVEYSLCLAGFERHQESFSSFLFFNELVLHYIKSITVLLYSASTSQPEIRIGFAKIRYRERTTQLF